MQSKEEELESLHKVGTVTTYNLFIKNNRKGPSMVRLLQFILLETGMCRIKHIKCLYADAETQQASSCPLYHLQTPPPDCREQYVDT
jgi:hypothetical protein